MASPITQADKPDKGCNPVVLGCAISFAITGAVAASLALVVWYVIREHDAAEVRRRAQWREHEFNRIKYGTDGNARAMIMDGELLAMLADDPDCVSHVTTLDFTMTTVTPEAAEHVARMKNVREITFYDTKELMRCCITRATCQSRTCTSQPVGFPPILSAAWQTFRS